uniref:Uncharacterized protein n=1 Tax=Seriola lalandi dorsalis TaxID=1841481 RepID=A0A3B4Z8V6_SERLL
MLSGFKMELVSLQMISLGSLLIFTDLTSSFPAAQADSSKCISVDKLEVHFDRFLERHWREQSVSTHLPQEDDLTCAQVANQMRGGLNSRSVSPWKSRLDHDVNRIPQHIVFAECLCQGCIINQHENLNYNSVPLFAKKMVMNKTKCKHCPGKYKVKVHYIQVPVACVCVVPK